MARVSGGRLIRKEDFNPKEQEFAGKLAFQINPFIQEVTQALQGNLTITENFSMEIKSVSVEVDGTGEITNTASFQTDLATISGILVLRHQVADPNNSNFPTSAPYCTFVKSNNIVNIQHVTGLPADTRFNLTLLLVSI